MKRSAATVVGLFLLGGCVVGAAVAHDRAVPPPGELSDCGIDPDIVPDFALVDLNPNSASYTQTRTRDEFLGSVFVVYFATAT